MAARSRHDVADLREQQLHRSPDGDVFAKADAPTPRDVQSFGGRSRRPSQTAITSSNPLPSLISKYTWHFDFSSKIRLSPRRFFVGHGTPGVLTSREIRRLAPSRPETH